MLRLEIILANWLWSSFLSVKVKIDMDIIISVLKHQQLYTSLKRLCIYSVMHHKLAKKKKIWDFLWAYTVKSFWPKYGHSFEVCTFVCPSVCVCVFLLSCYSRKGYQKGPVRTLAFLKNCDWINLFSLWAAISENYKPVKSWIFPKIPS